jgi:O-antigen ligase
MTARTARPILPRLAGRPDAAAGALAAAATIGLAAVAAHEGPKLSLGLLLGGFVFVAVVIGFVKAPHVVVACAIPYFCLLPMIKVLVSSQLAPTKDVIEIAAFVAAGILALKRRFVGEQWRGDQQVLVLTLLLLGLYVLNIGTAIRGGNVISLEWFHGVRLFGEPLLLLLVGLSVNDPRKTLHWAVKSLIVTACVAALIGLVQQKLGPYRLVDMGYSFNSQVRTIGAHLRSFGPFDEPFDYAAVLAFGLAAVLLWTRKRTVAALLGPVIAAGLLVSFVRGAALSAVALIALLLAKRGYATAATVVLAAAAATGVAFALLATQPTPGRVVQTGPSTYLSLNGRDRSWRIALGKPSSWPFGRGVGTFGTAAQRASRSRPPGSGGPIRQAADSGYLAAASDVGFIGLALLLALFVRIIVLLRSAIGRGEEAGWFGLAIIVILLLDAALRSSLTGFPTAHLGFLLLGLTLSATSQLSPLRERRAPQRGRDEYRPHL